MPLEKAMGIRHGQGKMGMPVTVAMGNAYYVFFMPMVIATRMRMPTVMGMPMTLCTGTYTIGKHAARGHHRAPGGSTLPPAAKE